MDSEDNNNQLKLIGKPKIEPKEIVRNIINQNLDS